MRAKTSSRPSQTAPEAYAARQAEIKNLLQEIGGLLGQHAQRQSKNPGNWGFAGDLASVAEQLTEIRDGLNPAC